MILTNGIKKTEDPSVARRKNLTLNVLLKCNPYQGDKLNDSKVAGGLITGARFPSQIVPTGSAFMLTRISLWPSYFATRSPTGLRDVV